VFEPCEISLFVLLWVISLLFDKLAMAILGVFRRARSRRARPHL